MRGPPPINGRCGGRQTEVARDTVTARWPGDGVCAETVARRRTLCCRWVMEAALAAVQRETHVEWRGATVVQRKGHGVVVEHADQCSLYGYDSFLLVLLVSSRILSSSFFIVAQIFSALE